MVFSKLHLTLFSTFQPSPPQKCDSFGHPSNNLLQAGITSKSVPGQKPPHRTSPIAPYVVLSTGLNGTSDDGLDKRSMTHLSLANTVQKCPPDSRMHRGRVSPKVGFAFAISSAPSAWTKTPICMSQDTYDIYINTTSR